MAFIKITESLLNETLTENGDKAFKSTLSPCLDYFSLIGGKREYVNDAASLFLRAFLEDHATALKLLFYTRDIRHGLGERRIFRFLFNSFALSYPDIAFKFISYIPEYGRYDDLLCALETPIEEAIIDFITKQLYEDLENKKNGKPVSLLAKWLPSINTSNDDARAMALYLAKRLNMSNADYRKTLSFLRKDLIIENNLREKQYDFDYSKVPSVALNKYNEAFVRNDQQRFANYLADVSVNKTKMNTAALDVVNFIKQVKIGKADTKEGLNYYETTWDALTKNAGINKRTIVVRDGSGSMTWGTGGNVSPLDIADAMALLTASRLEGEFHNKFITFSSSPELVSLDNCKNILEKVRLLKTYDDYSNTNIELVYNLIFNVYSSPDFKKEDTIDQIIIISDMQFDQATDFAGDKKLNSTFENFKSKFNGAGYKMPEIVFWNVNARNTQVPVTKNELGVKLISGSSQNVIDLVTKNPSLDPLDFMKQVLTRYAFVDEVLKEDKDVK